MSDSVGAFTYSSPAIEMKDSKDEKNANRYNYDRSSLRPCPQHRETNTPDGNR